MHSCRHRRQAHAQQAAKTRPCCCTHLLTCSTDHTVLQEPLLPVVLSHAVDTSCGRRITGSGSSCGTVFPRAVILTPGMLIAHMSNHDPCTLPSTPPTDYPTSCKPGLTCTAPDLVMRRCRPVCCKSLEALEMVESMQLWSRKATWVCQAYHS
jgi:hypothetical protein